MKNYLSRDELQNVYFSARDELESMLRRRVRDKDLAADLTQETFLKIDQITAPLPDADQARMYLFRIAKNLATDHQRKEARRSDILVGSKVVFEEHQPTPEQETLAKDQLEMIDKALADLPRHCRSVLIMSRLQGMTHSQIAEELNVSKSLVEKYAVKALLHCRAILNAS